MYRKHSNAGNGVSDFLFRAYFLFYDKKTGNFWDFFLFFTNIHFVHVITQKLGPISTFETPFPPYRYQQYVLKFSSINVGK